MDERFYDNSNVTYSTRTAVETPAKTYTETSTEVLNAADEYDRRAKIYLGFSAFFGVFTIIYYQFSHNVYSVYLTLLFLYPLALGFLPSFLLARISDAQTRKWAHSGRLEQRAAQMSPAGTKMYEDAGSRLQEFNRLQRKLSLNKVTANLWPSGVFALAFASMLQGIFDIAGTTSEYVLPLAVIGLVLMAIASWTEVFHR